MKARVLIPSLLLLAPLLGADEVEDALGELRAPSAARRTAAERHLAQNLGPEDSERLRAALRGGDAEVRARLARALGADDRHLELCAGLVAEPEAVLAETGASALRELLLRWNPRLAQGPVRGPDLDAALEERRDGPRGEVFLIELDGTLSEITDRLARLAPLPLGLALDPSLSSVPLRPLQTAPAMLYGTWEQVLVELARAYGVVLWLVGDAPVDELDAAPPFALFVHPLEASTRPPLDLLVEWVRTAQGAETAHERAAATRALADSGWPAALSWLERDARAHDSAAAWEGLLSAAGRGRVAGLFSATGVLERLCARADAGLHLESFAGRETSEAEALSILRALAALGPFDARGEAHVPRLIAGWSELDARERWWRLCVLEAWGRAAPAGGELAAALLTDPPGSHSPRLLLQALRTLVATGSTALRARTPGDPGSWLAAAQEPHEFREVARLCARSGALPPSSWRTGDALFGLTTARRLLVIEWALGVGDMPLALAQLLAGDEARGEWPDYEEPSGAGPPPRERWWRQAYFAEALHDWVLRGEGLAVEGLLAAARAELDARGEESAALDRLELLSGVAPPGSQPALLARVRARQGAAADPIALAHLLGGPAGVSARIALLRLLSLPEDAPQPPSEIVLEGLRRACECLRALERDEDVLQLTIDAFRMALAEPTHELALQLMDSWERPPLLVALPLAARERGPEPGL